jgi:predicted N-acyltransferase
MLSTEVLPSLASVDPTAWDALTGLDNPFVEHAFLSALEESGSVGTVDSGWVPRHVVVRDGDRLVGALPLYEKYDSYGEYIFDWSWARAALQAGIAYYPKLVSAVPFTPATGPRLLVAPDAASGPVLGALLRGLAEVAQQSRASSVHVLFPPEAEIAPLVAAGFSPRLSYQFHWERQAGWRTFDDFVAALRAPARKAVRKERATAAAHGLALAMRPGAALTDADWAALEAFYRGTVADKGAIAYLTPAFFALLRRRLGHRILAAMAHRDDAPVAGALFLHKGGALFGRYWGSHEALDALHFELCYYQPIAWGLEHGIERFEAGAQGEHKLKRGLLPRLCHSAHWFGHAGLSKAVARYLREETAGVQETLAALAAHTPYPRKSEP